MNFHLHSSTGDTQKGRGEAQLWRHELLRKLKRNSPGTGWPPAQRLCLWVLSISLEVDPPHELHEPPQRERCNSAGLSEKLRLWTSCHHFKGRNITHSVLELVKVLRAQVGYCFLFSNHMSVFKWLNIRKDLNMQVYWGIWRILLTKTGAFTVHVTDFKWFQVLLSKNYPNKWLNLPLETRPGGTPTSSLSLVFLSPLFKVLRDWAEEKQKEKI